MRYILLILVLFLSGCTITHEEFALANMACKDFGGLKYYSPLMYYSPYGGYGGYAKCNNGLVIGNLHMVRIASE